MNPDFLKTNRLQKPSRRRVHLFRLILLSLPIALLLVAELLLAAKFRFDYPGTTLRVQADYRTVQAAYRDYKPNPGFVRNIDGIRYRYNNMGFRNQLDIKPKTKDEFRVFLLGGSMAYGERASEVGQYQIISGQEAYTSDKTIAAYLADKLRGKIPNRSVTVYNGAFISYRLHHNYLQYLEHLRDLAPDLIITIDGVNEKFDQSNPYSYNVPTFEILDSPVVSFLRSKSYCMFYSSLLLRQSSLFYLATGRLSSEISNRRLDEIPLEKIRSTLEVKRQEYLLDKAVVAGLIQVYEQFQFACDQDQVPILFCTQPVLMLDKKKRLTIREERLLKYAATKRPRDANRFGVEILSMALEAKATTDPTFKYENLINVFDGWEENAYTDFCHLTPGANLRIAERLAARIEIEGWTK